MSSQDILFLNKDPSTDMVKEKWMDLWLESKNKTKQ